MKHLFIINPAAGSYNRTEEYSAVIHKLCRERGLNYEIRVSTAPGEAVRIAREAARTGEELRLYAALGRHLKFANEWKKYIITSEPEFEHYFGKRADKKRKFYNGKIQCNYYMFTDSKRKVGK